MAYGFLDIASTPSVHAMQAKMGSADYWRNVETSREFDRFTGKEAMFIAERDSFYMASVSEDGWPYVQHRGGPPGFVKLVDDTTLAFADFRGNRQYLTMGNVAADPRVSMIMVDYPRRARLKVFARAELVELDADPDLAATVLAPVYRGKAEHVVRLHLLAFDWNCPQHITPRFSEAEVTEAVAPLHARIAELAAENTELRSRLTRQGEP
ncbi:pyridoxamine 5'-phosphate oxidase family protein [Aurantiacibacter gilvus]|uniref:Pyridoxamine 5'-phosphate oxidase family protein n=1 Tax=Aurantiacibacter gilvus TaxID=3139141 RepID=A0ABU9IGN4_9SPHN